MINQIKTNKFEQMLHCRILGQSFTPQQIKWFLSFLYDSFEGYVNKWPGIVKSVPIRLD